MSLRQRLAEVEAGKARIEGLVKSGSSDAVLKARVNELEGEKGRLEGERARLEGEVRRANKWEE